jgi:hypothetical protein
MTQDGWLDSVVPDAPDARALANSHRDVFGWSLAADEPDWCTMRIPEAHADLAFQTVTLYKRPTEAGRPGSNDDDAPRHRSADLEAAAHDASPSAPSCGLWANELSPTNFAPTRWGGGLHYR